MMEKFIQRCLEADELHLQLKASQDQVTQARMTIEDERARRADLDKAHSDLQSELAKVSTVFLLLFYIKFPNLIYHLSWNRIPYEKAVVTFVFPEVFTIYWLATVNDKALRLVQMKR
jgi:uncharacterized membrane protein (DUF485 family)